MKLMDNFIPITTVAATFEPVTVSQAKARVDIGEFDATHDCELESLICACREEFENDTSIVTSQRTVKTYSETMYDGLQLQLRPVASISSIKYYDSNNAQQTLSTTVYGFDTAKRQIRLKVNQNWPTFTLRWDAWEITYVVGYSDAESVPSLAKAAILMLAAHRFEDPDMLHKTDRSAYENIVAKLMRSSYP